MNEHRNDLITVSVTTVPWFNKNEWMMVFDFLYSQTSQRAKGMEIIKMWKKRYQRLPAGIEGTYILLQVLEKPLQVNDYYDLQVFFSTAIMRFLNVCVTHDTVQGTFSRNAKYAKIPTWIIDLRHEIAHGINLPALDILKKACEFGYDWLYNKYWLPVSNLLRDYVFETDVKPMNYHETSLNKQNEITIQLKFLFETFECLVIFQHPKFNVKTINDIPDPECREKFLRDLKKFRAFFHINKDTDLSELSKSVIYAIHGCLSMARKDTKEQILDTLLNGFSFLCEEDLQTQLFENTSLEILPWNYVSLWLELLQVFCKFSMIEYLLIKLFNIMSHQNQNEHRKRMASLWVIEIAKALKKVQLFQIAYETNFENMDSSIKSNRIERAKYLIEKTESMHQALNLIMTFDPETKIPFVVSNFKQFSKVALKEPNQYIKLCLPFILELNTPKLDSNLVIQLNQLIDKSINAKSQVTNEEKSSDNNIYSVEDLKKYMGGKIPKYDEEEDDLEMESEDSVVVENTLINDDDDSKYEDIDNHWKMASEHLKFENCPLGLLPWQDKNRNPVLQIFLES